MYDLCLEQFLNDQRKFSQDTFGPGERLQGVLNHIRKEVNEVDASDGKDIFEWIDIVILAFDGALRQGFEPYYIVEKLREKARINRNRDWPDWREMSQDEPIEHERDCDDGERELASAAEFEDIVREIVAENFTPLPSRMEFEATDAGAFCAIHYSDGGMPCGAALLVSRDELRQGRDVVTEIVSERLKKTHANFSRHLKHVKLKPYGAKINGNESDLLCTQENADWFRSVFEEFLRSVDHLGSSRDLSIAKKALEDASMRIQRHFHGVKGVEHV